MFETESVLHFFGWNYGTVDPITIARIPWFTYLKLQPIAARDSLLRHLQELTVHHVPQPTYNVRPQQGGDPYTKDIVKRVKDMDQRDEDETSAADIEGLKRWLKQHPEIQRQTVAAAYGKEVTDQVYESLSQDS